MNRSIKVLAIYILGIAGLLSVLFTNSFVTASTEETTTISDEVQWGYEGNEAPENWGGLAKEFSACAIGSQQSPINIETQDVTDADLPEIEFAYQQAPLNIVNKGHTIQVDYAPNSSITLEGAKYDLIQYHFHDPSEHEVDGFQYPMEVHLVHQNAETGDLAVVGVFLEYGAENKALTPLWSNIPTEKGAVENVPDTEINAVDLLPEDTQNYYRYYGSLTIPPCSEVVNWIVIKEPIPVSARQVEQFTAVVGENARPVQELGNRFLLD